MKTERELYETLSLVRHAENKIVEVYPTDVMQCPVHLSIGQESIAAALCSHLRAEDLKTGTHRSHALFLANGGDLVAFFGELLGRACGCSGGMGGSMHLVDRQRGLVGTTSIVGAALPIAVGLGMAVTRPVVVAALFGDGGADEGAFAESLNFAKLKRLPIVFVCENNGYSVYTPRSARQAALPSEVARSFGIETLTLPIEVANDVFALYRRFDLPIEAVRQGAGPLFVECQTVRRYDHNGVRDDVKAGFREASEAALFDNYCPMKLARRRMIEAEWAAIDADVKGRVDRAYQKALSAAPASRSYNHLPFLEWSSSGNRNATPRRSTQAGGRR